MILNRLKERVFGLDLIRAVAISLVLLSHGTYLLFPEVNNLYITGLRVLGATGVDLFFVLSGFLIGNILLKQLKDDKILFNYFIIFWKRRWLRVLPNYFVVLALNILISIFLNQSFVNKIELYPFLLQNFSEAHPNFFTEAWSLSVEEYSYLFLPFILYLFISFFGKIKPTKLFLLITILSLFCSFLLKLNFYNSIQINSYKNWSSLFRKVVVYRLDSIYLGFLLIYVFSEFKEFCLKYNKLLLLFGGMVFLVLHLYIMLFNVEPQTNLFFYVFVYLLVVGISFGLMFPYCIKLKINFLWLKKIIEYISIRSFAIYLINYSLVLLNIERLSLNNFDSLILYILITLFFSELLFQFIEKPFLNYRNRKL